MLHGKLLTVCDMKPENIFSDETSLTCCLIMAVLYVSRRKAIMFYRCFIFFFIENVISKVKGY